MAIVLGLVALLSIIALTGLNNSRSAEDHFVTVIRNAHPELSADDVSDAELLLLAKRSCGPDGLTGSDRGRLEHLGIDETSFRDEAASFCPSR